jgi:uncharacterized protein
MDLPILKKPLKRGKDEVTPVETDQYIDLGSMFFPEDSSLGGSGVKVAEIYRFEDLGGMTQPVYDGNVLLIDYSNMANDTNELKRVTNELKNVARDCNGDVAAIGNNLIVVTPNGMRIDRNKIRGGFK